MINIIIPSAKVIQKDLQNLGVLPPIIYPLGKGIVFDYLIEQYKEINPNFRIICHEEIKKVESKLSQYINIDFDIIKIDKIGDLGETIYHGIIDDQNQELIINFADTLVMESLDFSESDLIYYSEDFVSDLWTFFEINDGIITEVLDKMNNSISKENKKLFIGLFYIKNGKLFKRLLKESFYDKTVDSFYEALVKYSRINPMQVVKSKNWYDVGHEQKYYRSQLEVKAREFNDIQIDSDRGILKKRSKNIDKFIDEILWYLKLPSDIEYIRPRIFSYSTKYDNSYVEMEYYSYHTLHELLINGDLSFNQWMIIFKRLKFLIDDLRRYKLNDEDFKLDLEEMYLAKTIKRIEQLKKNVDFEYFFDNPISINNTEYKSLNEITKVIKDVIPSMLFDVKNFSIIHGDLCFSNILIDNNLSIIKLIDPRGKFGRFDIFGDPRYELAKLVHSIDGKYDYIIKDKFYIENSTENGSIIFHINDTVRDFDIYECFLLAFQDEMQEIKIQIELIEALLFLSMIPLHSDNTKRQLAMLATGILILDRIVNIKK